MRKVAVVLLNLGGPSKLSDVKPFLFNLFYDRAIIDLPNPIRWLIAKTISTVRENKSKNIYKQMGGRSPILEQTQKQAKSLEKALNKEECAYKVFVSMRYWHPFSRDTIKEIEEYNPKEILLVPLYPQFSSTTSGSSVNDFYESMKNTSLSDRQVKTVCCFFTHKDFIKAHASLIEKGIKKVKNKKIKLLFSAHGLPVSVIEKGDPYEYQMKKTVKRVMSKLPKRDIEYKLCYQSKVGPKEWLKPSTESEIIKASKAGYSIVVIPIAFVSEHSETLVELDIDYKDLATKEGAPEYIRIKALGTDEFFIDSLKDICLELSGFEGKRRKEVVSCSEKSCGAQFGLCLNKYRGKLC